MSLDKPIAIIHVGTNDVAKMEVGAMLSCYNNLISQIRSKSNTSIVMSALLPRPVDYNPRDDKVKHLNNKLEKLCRDRKVHRVATVREKSLENEFFSRSGKSQGILILVREISKKW